MKSTPIEKRFVDSCRNDRLINKGDLVLVGLSGGPDSVALTCLLDQLKEKLGVRLHLAHVNHQLRPEADQEEIWVRKLADKLNLPLTVARIKVKELAAGRKMSLEEAAREARYRFFNRLAAKIGAAKIALAHTADDQAETVLLWLIRGAGSRGLRGMLGQRDKIIRPFLGVWKKELLEYLKKNRLPFCLDQSNFQLDFTRNRIRHQLLPLLVKFNPQIKHSLNQTAQILSEEDSYLSEQTEKMIKRCPGAGLINKLPDWPPVFQRRVLRQLIARAKGDLKQISFGHTEKIRTMMGKLDWRLDLPKITVSRRGGKLKMSRAKNKKANSRGKNITNGGSERSIYRIKTPGQVIITPAGLKITAKLVKPSDIPWKKIRSAAPRTIFLDPGPVRSGLVIRFRRPGDRFYPLGSPGSRKLQDFLVDKGVPRAKRDRLPLLLIGSKIAWVVGQEISELFRLRPETKRALKLTCQRL